MAAVADKRKGRIPSIAERSLRRCRDGRPGRHCIAGRTADKRQSTARLGRAVRRKPVRIPGLAAKRIFHIGSVTTWVHRRKRSGPVAQLDRASDFYSEGCRFESCRDRQIDPNPALVELTSRKRHVETCCLLRPAGPHSARERRNPVLWARPDAAGLFDHRDEILRKLSPEDFQRYKDTRASNVLGWDNPGRRQRLANCLGETNHLQLRCRARSQARQTIARGIAASWSRQFLYQRERRGGRATAYPAALERMLDVGVANLGVGATGRTRRCSSSKA